MLRIFTTRDEAIAVDGDETRGDKYDQLDGVARWRRAKRRMRYAIHVSNRAGKRLAAQAMIAAVLIYRGSW